MPPPSLMSHPRSADVELARLQRTVRVHEQVRELFRLFARGIPSTLNLGAALEPIVREIPHIIGTGRTSVWLHDRRARDLALAASSDPAFAARGQRVANDDPQHPAARGLRLERPAFVGDPPILIAPLRGWRRALGTLVLEGAAPGDAQAIDLTDELARQLSIGVENIQLLDGILGQRRLLEDTFNSLVDLVVVLDNELRIVQTNEVFAARVGCARDDAAGRKIDELVGPDMAAWVAADPTPAASGGSGQVDDPRLGGTFLLTASPLINHEGLTVGRVVVARDITRQTKLEAERALLRERLAQSEKLASLGQFVAGIAHEMNNPLQGVLGHLELLMETSEPAHPFKRELRQIYQDADRAARIVRNLLVFTGSRRMARRRLQVDRVISRALASRGARMRKARIEVVRVQGEGLPPVLGDPLLLQQALLNVLVNAEHAVQDASGRRRIEITTATDAARERVTITVRDTGPGIPSEILPRVFDPFFTTKEVGQGTGLGLAITYGIVQEHGGAITAANADDGGAIFQIELPAAPVVIK